MVFVTRHIHIKINTAQERGPWGSSGCIGIGREAGMAGAASREGAGWFARKQDPSRFPEGLLLGASGQKSAL